MMCCGDLFPLDRPETNHDHGPAGEAQAPIFIQPRPNEALQILQIAENPPLEESSSHSATSNTDEDEIAMANNAAPERYSQNVSESSQSWRKSLADSLRLGRVECVGGSNFIIPMKKLDELITTPVIERAIREENSNMSEVDSCRHAERIEKRAKRLFAIYAFRAQGATLRFLLNTDLCDDDLPLEKHRNSSGYFLSKRGLQEKIVEFDEWENDLVTDFVGPQWWMIAPFFNQGQRACLRLEDDTILPFSPLPEPKKEDDEGISYTNAGGYGEVTAYRIHPDYHNFRGWDKSVPMESQPLIAVKKLHQKDRIEYLKEKTILVLLGDQNHPHLIQLLATYLQKKSYHFVFPCADANLRAYWSRYPVPNFGRDGLLWSIRQMAGIADGLYQIHNFKVKYPLNVEKHLYTPVSGRKYRVLEGEEKYGRHGDIKAENLLWFKKENVLKITDFGLGRFHGQNSKSNIDPRRVVHALTYEPPECTIGVKVSRKYDIWSMGCLFLEFITWQLMGNESITEFADERGRPGVNSVVDDDNFFTASEDSRQAVVRDAVVQWVAKLHLHEKCSALNHELLNLIMQKMLRVNPEDRIEAVDLKEVMKIMVEKAEKSDDYLIGSDSPPGTILSAT